MHNRITESKRFTVDGYTITFTAGVKRDQAVVVFGVMTGLDAVPVFTLEKTGEIWRKLNATSGK